MRPKAVVVPVAQDETDFCIIFYLWEADQIILSVDGRQRYTLPISKPLHPCVFT